MRNPFAILLLLLALVPACAAKAKPESKVAHPGGVAVAEPEVSSVAGPPEALSPEEVRGEPKEGGSEVRAAENPVDTGSSASSESSGKAADVAAPDEGSRVAEKPEPRPDPSKALPELGMRHVGMHIGGESNTAEAKKPFLDAIEKRKKSILLCYREVSSPRTGGTFGIDLRVPAEGGAPEVRKLRHKLGGFEFDACMHKAFESVRFPALPRPTMVSYSLRFEFREKR